MTEEYEEYEDHYGEAEKYLRMAEKMSQSCREQRNLLFMQAQSHAILALNDCLHSVGARLHESSVAQVSATRAVMTAIREGLK